MRVEIVPKVDDDLLRELGVASTRFYGAELERIQLAHMGHGTTTYVVARDSAGRAVGLAPVYIARPPWHPAMDLAAPGAVADETTLCLVGSYGVYANYLTIGASLSDGAAVRVAGALIEQACSVARAAGCRLLMLPYLDPAQARLVEAYEDAAAAVTDRDKAVLPVAWGSFDEYVSWLPARRRTPVRRERRRFQDSGIKVRERRMADVAGEVAPLLAATEQRHGRAADPEQIDFHYTLLGMYLEEDFFALVAYQADRPVACSLLLACGDRWISKAWGRDYAAAGDPFLYFNLLFYEPVSRAIERGIGVLDYGLGGLETKTQRGCAVERLRTLVIAADHTLPEG
jgi:uncharacterized protein